MKPIKILVSARDPASANDLVPILLSMLKDKRFFVKILAQNPAHDFFMRKIPNLNIGQLVQYKANYQMDEIDRNIIAFFDEFDPDCLLTGISGPNNFGIDEILLNIGGKRRKVKTFSVQSYWGDVNKSLGFIANTIFVIDDFANKITLSRASDSNTIITGPLQSEIYNKVDVNKERTLFKDKYDGHDVSMVGLFGQPLFEHGWYRDTMKSFIETLNRVDQPVKVVYKPHPKESLLSIKWMTDQLSRSNLDFIVPEDQEVLSVIAGTDVAVSLFSTIGYDLQNLLKKSEYAFSIPLYLFFNEECRRWFKRYCHLSKIPMSENGAIVIDREEDMERLILKAFSSWERLNLHSILLRQPFAVTDQYAIISGAIISDVLN